MVWELRVVSCPKMTFIYLLISIFLSIEGPWSSRRWLLHISPLFLFTNIYNLVIKRERGHCKKFHIVKHRGFVGKTNKMRRSLTIVQSFQVRKLDLSQISRFCAGCCTEPGLFVPWTKDIPLVLVPQRPLLPVIRKGLKVVTIEIMEIVTTIIVTTFKRCNNLNML